jgi:periplasmic protein TonB
METKKHRSKDNESNKSLFFQIGLCISLFLTFTAFEWRTQTSSNFSGIDFKPIDIIETVPITPPEQIPPEPPKPIALIIQEVKDDVVTTTQNLFDPEQFDYLNYQPHIPIELPEEVENTDNTIILVPGTPASFPGGEEALFEYLQNNTIYPRDALIDYITGTVHVQFVIERDGSVSNVNVIRGVHPLLDAEATRVVQKMPSWIPGKQYERPVRVWQTLPIKFSLK